MVSLKSYDILGPITGKHASLLSVCHIRYDHAFDYFASLGFVFNLFSVFYPCVGNVKINFMNDDSIML